MRKCRVNVPLVNHPAPKTSAAVNPAMMCQTKSYPEHRLTTAASAIWCQGRQGSIGGTLDEVNDRLYASRVDAGWRDFGRSRASARKLAVIKVRDVPCSLLATAMFRWAGARSALVTVEGLYPVLLTAGSIQCGRLFLRCKTIPIELGAASNASLVLGERVFINIGATIVATHSITIGDDCLIGDLVAIFDTDHHAMEPSRPTRRAPVRLGKNVWVGRSATILPGVTIGDHAVVAAGSIVTSDIPARTLVAGVPARPIRTLDIPDGWRRN